MSSPATTTASPSVTSSSVTPPPAPMRLSHTSSVVYQQLGRRAQTADYQWQRRAALISQCFYRYCCDPHGLGSISPNCCTTCKASLVKYTSKCLSLSVSAICTVATCGIFLCCCECSAPPKQAMEARIIEIIPSTQTD